MHFKHRIEMEAKEQNERFTTKAMELPMVSLGYQQALAYYLRAKEWSPLVHRSLSLAENTVKYAAGTAQPIVSAPLTKADHVAASWLEYLENKYPAIKKTPEEMKASYYDGSRLQKGVDSVTAAKSFGLEKITNTRSAVGSAMQNSTEAAMTTVRYSILAINWALDNLEATIDRHIAKPDAKMGPDHDHTTITERLGHMCGKATDGVKFRATQNVEALKNSLNEQIKQIHAAMVLIEFARRQSEAATKQVENFWEGTKEKSAATTLSTTKWLTQSLSHATERVSNFAGPYLPETGRNSLTTANDYAKDVARTFDEAETLTDLKVEVFAQAKEKLVAVQNGFANALDYLVQHLPMDVMDFHLSDLEEEDIEMLEFNRDHRWPVRSSRQSPAYEFMNGGPAH